MKQSTIIGISGGSGSGKTSFIKDLRKYFTEDQVTIISQDDYYKPRHLQLTDENGIQNFDLPESIDLPAFIDDVKKVLKGHSIVREEYTFNNEKATADLITFRPAPVIIIEGLFIFHNDEIISMLDLSIIISARASDKIIRRIMRDQKERNYPLDDVLYRYKHHVMPAYEKFIEPYIDNVDIIVNNNHSYKRSINVVVAYINSKL